MISSLSHTVLSYIPGWNTSYSNHAYELQRAIFNGNIQDVKKLVQNDPSLLTQPLPQGVFIVKT